MRLLHYILAAALLAAVAARGAPLPTAAHDAPSPPVPALRDPAAR